MITCCQWNELWRLVLEVWRDQYQTNIPMYTHSNGAGINTSLVHKEQGANLCFGCQSSLHGNIEYNIYSFYHIYVVYKYIWYTDMICKGHHAQQEDESIGLIRYFMTENLYSLQVYQAAVKHSLTLSYIQRKKSQINPIPLTFHLKYYSLLLTIFTEIWSFFGYISHRLTAQHSFAASWHNHLPISSILTTAVDSCGIQGGTFPSDTTLNDWSLDLQVWEWLWTENGVKRNWSSS